MTIQAKLIEFVIAKNVKFLCFIYCTFYVLYISYIFHSTTIKTFKRIKRLQSPGIRLFYIPEDKLGTKK